MANKKKVFSTLTAVTVGAVAGSALVLRPVVALANDEHADHGEKAEKSCKGDKAEKSCKGEKSCNGAKAEGTPHAEKSCKGEKGCSGKK